MNFSLLELIEVFFRSLISLITLFFITKIMGKKQVSQLSMLDYVIGISIGSFAAEMATDLDTPIFYGVASIVFFGIPASLISYLTIKSIKLRRIITGAPTIVMAHGKILENGLKKSRFDVNDLLEECRIKGYFDLSEIDYAVMEANGELSFLPKFKPVTAKDMNLKIEKQGLCANIIIDSKVMKENLKLVNKNQEWLNKELKIKGISLKEILLATIDINEKVVIYKKEDAKNTHNILE